MKIIYENGYGEQVKISKRNNNFGNVCLFLKSENGDVSEICIPKDDMVKVARKIIKEYKGENDENTIN